MRELLFSFLLASNLIGSESLYYYSFGKKVYLNHTHTQQKSNISSKSATKDIILIPKDEKSLNFIKSSIEIEYVEKIGKIYRFRALNPDEAIKISAKLFESDLVEFASPNFNYSIELREVKIEDEFFLDSDKAWHFRVTNSDLALNLAKGDGVRVGVYDNGVDIEHPELKSNYLFGYNFDIASDESSQLRGDSSEYHGTAVAGLISSAIDGVGTVGVAPNSYLIPMRDDVSKSSDITKLRAFEYAKNHEIDVLNCSWGTYDVSEAVAIAIEDLAKNGRGGKGSLILFAVGNDGGSDEIWARDESALESVIAVGAIDNNLKRATYSNYGEALDLVAPGGYFDIYTGEAFGITSTDLVGESGISSGDYVTLENSINLVGTSFATPIVSALIANIISINPDLTADEIKDILYLSAQKIGDVEYERRGDYTFNREYGYGLIDSKRALEMAMKRSFEVKISKGWNLIGNFSNSNIEFKNFKALVYRDGIWIENPDSIESEEGFWLYSDRDFSYSFKDTKEYDIELDSKWRLYVANRNIRLYEDEQSYYLFRDREWIRYPDGDLKVIKKGEGFWARLES